MNESVPIVSKIMMEVISLILGKTCLLVFFILYTFINIKSIYLDKCTCVSPMMRF